MQRHAIRLLAAGDHLHAQMLALQQAQILPALHLGFKVLNLLDTGAFFFPSA